LPASLNPAHHFVERVEEQRISFRPAQEFPNLRSFNVALINATDDSFFGVSPPPPVFETR
jgi:hypothetical protein